MADRAIEGEVLIVGAGPVGLTAALVLWSRTLELLDGLGGAGRFLDVGIRAHGASLYGHGKRLVHATLDDIDSPYPFALMIPQSDTERMLEEWVTSLGVKIERRVEVRAITPDAADVGATLVHADGREESIRTPWLVACDGAHSTVRHQLGLEFAGNAEPDDWILADVHVAGAIATDEISLYWHERGVLAMFPMIGGRFRMIADIGPHPELAQPETPTLAQAQALLDERGPGGLALKDPVWLSGFRINERKLAHYRHGRVLFAGDAAHVHSPAGGQGMNTGLVDAIVLGQLLGDVLRGDAPASALEQYETLRRPAAQSVLRLAGRLTTAATLRGPGSRWIRNMIFRAIGSIGPIREKLQLNLSGIARERATVPFTQWSAPSMAATQPHASEPLPEPQPSAD